MRAVTAEVVFEVTIVANLVVSIRRAERSADMHIPESRLAVSTELARNHQKNGCIDGCYRFEDPEQARSFALLALDFVKRTIDKRSEQVEALDTGAEYLPDRVGTVQ